MSGYGKFAWYYDRLTENVDHDGIAAAIDGYVKRFGGRKGILLDLACGTGTLCEKLAVYGYDVIGVDGSEMMLDRALDKKFESGLPIQYLKQDMTKLDMFGTIDVTVCVLDSINHLPDIDAVKKTFERVSLFSYPDGLFIFDVNTRYKHRHILNNNAFTYDLEEFFCVWQNYYDEKDDSVEIFLDFFEKEEDGRYSRYQENFIERYYGREALIPLAEQAGFELLGEFDGYSLSPPKEDSQRVTYVLKKVRG